MSRSKTFEQPRDDALKKGSRRAEMPGDRPTFSERGKEKPSSQSQTRYFTKAQAQKWHEIARLKLNKKHVIMKGGMERGETSNQSKSLEQQRDDARGKVADIADYKESWANYFYNRGHRDRERLESDIDNIQMEYEDRVLSINQQYERLKKEDSKEQ